MGQHEPFIPDETLFEAVRVGQQTEVFLRSTDTGRALYDKALNQYRTAVAEFEQLSVEQIMTKPERVLAIRHKMDIARAFIVWADTVVGDGRRAEDELRARDDNDSVID